MTRPSTTARRRFTAVPVGALVAVAVALALCIGLGLASCQASTKTVHVGVRTDIPGMSSMDPKTGEYSGFEVDLANEVFKRVYGSNVHVVFVGVSGETRETMLDDGAVDALIASYTITDQRKELRNISQPYHTSSVKILVNRSSGYAGIADLNGRTIGVLENSTTADALRSYAQSKGVTVFPNEYDSYLAIKDSLSSGLISGFCTDNVILAGYLDDGSMLLPDSFANQDYGVATRKDDATFAASVDDAITALKGDGTLASLEQKWAPYFS